MRAGGGAGGVETCTRADCSSVSTLPAVTADLGAASKVSLTLDVGAAIIFILLLAGLIIALATASY